MATRGGTMRHVGRRCPEAGLWITEVTQAELEALPVGESAHASMWRYDRPTGWALAYRESLFHLHIRHLVIVDDSRPAADRHADAMMAGVLRLASMTAVLRPGRAWLAALTSFDPESATALGQETGIDPWSRNGDVQAATEWVMDRWRAGWSVLPKEQASAPGGEYAPRGESIGLAGDTTLTDSPLSIVDGGS